MVRSSCLRQVWTGLDCGGDCFPSGPLRWLSGFRKSSFSVLTFSNPSLRERSTNVKCYVANRTSQTVSQQLQVRSRDCELAIVPSLLSSSVFLSQISPMTWVSMQGSSTLFIAEQSPGTYVAFCVNLLGALTAILSKVSDSKALVRSLGKCLKPGQPFLLSSMFSAQHTDYQTECRRRPTSRRHKHWGLQLQQRNVPSG